MEVFEIISSIPTIVIGIVGSIIGGIIVFYITRWLGGRKDNSEHLKQVNLANIEVINIVKSYIADEKIPDKEIFNSIISSVAKDFSVLPSEMYPINTYCEILITEILKNSYVPSERKRNLTTEIRNYMIEITRSENICEDCEYVAAVMDDKQILNIRLKRQQMILMMSFLAAGLFLIIALFIFMPLAISSESLDNPVYLILLFILEFLAMGATLMAMTYYRNSSRKLREQRKYHTMFNNNLLENLNKK